MSVYCDGRFLALGRLRLGWDTWGNECRCDVEMAAGAKL